MATRCVVSGEIIPTFSGEKFPTLQREGSPIEPGSLMEDRLYRTRIVDGNQGQDRARNTAESHRRRLRHRSETARKLRDATSDPSGPITRTRHSRFTEHTEYVRERLEAGVPIAQIVRDLRRAGDKPIPYTSFWEFAIKLQAKSEEPREEVRFETAPAKQSQCDWADFGSVSEDGQIQTLSLFVMVLGFSRHTFARFVTSMDESSLQREHHAAFVDFGGVPSQILYDNMKTVTTGRDACSEPIWQRSFADFAGRYGFTPKCARPYRAKTKGKVERTIGFIRRSFFAGRTFSDITDANAQLTTWLAEVNMRRHGTHGEFVHERLAAERPLLIQLRDNMLTIERVVARTVDAEGAIVYESNHYELPRGFRGRTLTVRVDGRRCASSTPEP